MIFNFNNKYHTEYIFKNGYSVHYRHYKNHENDWYAELSVNDANDKRVEVKEFLDADLLFKYLYDLSIRK